MQVAAPRLCGCLRVRVPGLEVLPRCKAYLRLGQVADLAVAVPDPVTDVVLVISGENFLHLANMPPGPVPELLEDMEPLVKH